MGANSACRSRRGGPRNRADRVTYALTGKQVAHLKAATEHAAHIGLPFTRMINIHWQAAGVDPARMVKATGRFMDLLTKALARYDSRTAWVWVHEDGERKGAHCHILVHVPAELVSTVARLQKRWLRTISGTAYRRGVIITKPIGGRLGLEIGNPELHLANLQVALGYICKGAPQDVLDASKFDRSHEPGGRIVGKRCSTSQNTGTTMRSI